MSNEEVFITRSAAPSKETIEARCRTSGTKQKFQVIHIHSIRKMKFVYTADVLINSVTTSSF